MGVGSGVAWSGMVGVAEASMLGGGGVGGDAVGTGEAHATTSRAISAKRVTFISWTDADYRSAARRSATFTEPNTASSAAGVSRFTDQDSQPPATLSR